MKRDDGFYRGWGGPALLLLLMQTALVNTIPGAVGPMKATALLGTSIGAGVLMVGWAKGRKISESVDLLLTVAGKGFIAAAVLTGWFLAGAGAVGLAMLGWNLVGTGG